MFTKLAVIQPERRLGSKDDERDAFELAEILQTGRRCRRVYKDPGRFLGVREASRVYTHAHRRRGQNQESNQVVLSWSWCSGGRERTVHQEPASGTNAKPAWGIANGTRPAVSGVGSGRGAQETGQGRVAAGSASPLRNPDSGDGPWHWPGTSGPTSSHCGYPPPVPNPSAVLGLLWIGGGDALIIGLGPYRGAMGCAPGWPRPEASTTTATPS